MAEPLKLDLHLDLVGGLSGDMFVAALIDLAPDLEPGIEETLRRGGRLLDGVSCHVQKHDDGLIVGRRFIVARKEERRTAHPNHGHDHVDWRLIRSELEGCDLAPAVKRHAIGIFGLLAEAEARVHGRAAEDVSFHEVGAWDSTADIVAAAHLIEATAASNWTISPVPLGSGRVQTAHGVLPVPAPATALLLEGFATVDDGVDGERVTPTGAAILRYLARDSARIEAPRRLTGSGFGFGSRRLEGISNCARVLRFERMVGFLQTAGNVAIIEFEVDDQSAEDLAVALDRLRAAKGVYDVLQTPAFGKKGRLLTSIRVLTDPAVVDEAAALCFDETSTIGLRHRLERRKMLPRETGVVNVGERAVRVKIAHRPAGLSAKAEVDDLADAPDRLAREALRQSAEMQSVKEKP
ncbi:MAG TPA: LarC family nickel insertion protein [Roseiarcus sp.]|nr:LarC family nickel insertion protein [Roseiarcus sp.]